MIALIPSPLFYDHQLERYRAGLLKAAVLKQRLEMMADLPIVSNGRRLLRAYVLASKFVDYFTTMIRATEVHIRRPASVPPRRELTAFYNCPICAKAHAARLQWPDEPEFDLPARLFAEGALRKKIRKLHPELEFDTERMSFR
jgi:hypothetical protein